MLDGASHVRLGKSRHGRSPDWERKGEKGRAKLFVDGFDIPKVVEIGHEFPDVAMAVIESG